MRVKPRKAEGNRPGLPRSRYVPQMHLENRARSVRRRTIAWNERRPGSQSHRNRRIGLVLQIRDRIVPPIIDGLRFLDTLDFQSRTRGWNRFAPSIVYL